MEPLGPKAQKIYDEMQAQKARDAIAPPVPAIIAVDPTAAANATIKMDGRTGRAFTKVANIVPDPDQPRKGKSMDVEEIARLGGSLKKKQLQPIVVEWKPELSKWMIVTGERRWLAAISAGLEMIACVFIFNPLSAGERLLMQGVENLKREDFTDEERADLFRRLMALNGWSQVQLAREMNLHPGTVSRALMKEQGGELRGAIPEASSVDRPDTSAEVLGDTSLPAGDDTPELRGAIPKPPKKKGKRGPKGGKVIIYKTAGCTMTLAFKQRPTQDEIHDALRDVLEQVSGERREAA